MLPMTRSIDAKLLFRLFAITTRLHLTQFKAAWRSYMYCTPKWQRLRLAPVRCTSMSPTKDTPEAALPDTSLPFHTLLKHDAFVPQPGGIFRSFLYSRTSLPTGSSTPTTPIRIQYGNSQKNVDSIWRKDGTGRFLDEAGATQGQDEEIFNRELGTRA